MNDNVSTHAADKTVRGKQRRPDKASLATRGRALLSLPTLAGARLAGESGMRIAGAPLPPLADGEGDGPQPSKPLAA